MSYHVDSKTLLFDDLTADEAEELEGLVRDLVLLGKTYASEHESFKKWSEVVNFEKYQTLLFMSTIFPARALLSVLNFMKQDPLSKVLKPHNLDAVGGPVCFCGRPSKHEDGWCGVVNCGDLEKR